MTKLRRLNSPRTHNHWWIPLKSQILFFSHPGYSWYTFHVFLQHVRYWGLFFTLTCTGSVFPAWDSYRRKENSNMMQIDCKLLLQSRSTLNDFGLLTKAKKCILVDFFCLFCFVLFFFRREWSHRHVDGQTPLAATLRWKVEREGGRRGERGGGGGAVYKGQEVK